MAPPNLAPEPQALGQAFAWLDQLGYAKLSRWPLFTARCWSPSREHRAWSSYQSRLCNSEEVAIPWLYWRTVPEELRELFHHLLRGEPNPAWNAPEELGALLDASAHPRWRVIPRFGRYILASLRGQTEENHVYFGDDTLYLMQRARELLVRLPSTKPLRVLDLCCGGGGVGLALPPFQGSLLGVDVNPSALELARAASIAQGLERYRYHLGSVDEVVDEPYDLVVGNPPSLPPELGGTSTLYATGAAGRWLEWLSRLERSLSPQGRLLLTVFSLADGPSGKAHDAIYLKLSRELSRPFCYTVRRQFPLGAAGWLRHVALELLPETESARQRFVECAASFDLPALGWRRGGS